MQTFKPLKVILESRQWGENKFLSGFETSVASVEDAKHSGCQMTSRTGKNMDQVKDFLLKIRIISAKF
jgi:hypothetical protein